MLYGVGDLEQRRGAGDARVVRLVLTVETCNAFAAAVLRTAMERLCQDDGIDADREGGLHATEVTLERYDGQDERPSLLASSIFDPEADACALS